MGTFLLAWNPKRWYWEDLPQIANKVQRGDAVTLRWSCGKSKRIQKGDRFFLIRLGKEPKGIFASGKIIRDAYEDKHWENEKAARGERTMFVQIQFDVMLNPETDIILPRSALDEGQFSGMHWDTQISGVVIPQAIALKLEQTWQSFVASQVHPIPEEVSESESIYEGAVRVIKVNSYERNPEARQICINHYGSNCVVCGFDFSATYGQVGEGFIHVHHLKELSQIGEEYKVNPILDLRPVCPNCHAIIHKRKPAYSIEEVKKFLRDR